MQQRRSRTLVGVAISACAALLLVACVLPDTVGATEPSTTTPADAPTPSTACGLDVAAVIDDDAMLDDSAAPAASDATGAYRAAVEPGDYAVTLDMESLDGELTTPEAFEFSVDAGETYLGADFGLDEFDVGEPLPFTGSTTSKALRLGLVALLVGTMLLGLMRLMHRHAGVRR